MSKKLNLINGNFITLDHNCPQADAISIENGKISGINSPDSKSKTIDLKGATVIPGFIDSHFHLVNLGRQLDTLQLKDCKSASEIAKMVYKKSKKIGINDWILGFGWDQTSWIDNEFPKLHILNDLNLQQPVFLT